MGKLSVAIYIAVAVLVLLLVSRSPRSPAGHGRGGHHRRLKLRPPPPPPAAAARHHHEPVPFDPLVAELERHREDKQWEREYFEHAHPEVVRAAEPAPGEEAQPEWGDFVDAEDYLNDEERFNVTNRSVGAVFCLLCFVLL
ncbi:hypothetical protein EUGRSUZ_J00346 [Eucalyptus grandis]|uniref:Uncharacterized protein n=2 Tax=Eucalyptus grandis TaxID=71139 RepID=A0ACC3J233_EUCGR|nr:hypothetical protein EUGRSUZ_J00346 [Eucalyptus grandis]